MNTNIIDESLRRLLNYCKVNEFNGYDPLDVLNSTLLHRLNLDKSKITRIIFSQFFKRSPINFRSLFGVPITQNPKGHALFISALLEIDKVKQNDLNKDLINKLRRELLDSRIKKDSGVSWGYPFPWQSRTFFLPPNSPTLVPTIFVGMAFLDLYEYYKNEKDLEIAQGIKNFLIDHVSESEDGSVQWAYSPSVYSDIYNVTLLASGLIARIAAISGEKDGFAISKKAVLYVCSKQFDDGSWYYGSDSNQRWKDSFHTAYNLWGIADYNDYSTDKTFLSNLDKGYEYFKREFILKNGAVKYFHNKNYPYEIHSSAVAILTFLKFGDVSIAVRVAQWAINNMQHESGYYYFRKGRFWKNKVQYMRWTQGWMALALSKLLSVLKGKSF